jgi:hypothetical protein
MAGWVPITIETLYEAKVAALIDACSGSALGSGQADRAAGLIQGCVDKVRRKVASCANNRVDQDQTRVPAGLRDDTVKLVIAALKGAVEMELTEDERRELARIERDLNRVAAGEDVVDQPDTPVEPEVEATGGSPSFGTRGQGGLRAREFTRTHQDG